MCDTDKDIGTRILDDIIDYVENPTEDKLQFIVDTLIQFNAYIDIINYQNMSVFRLSRNRFFHTEFLDLPTYHVIESLVDRYRACNRTIFEEFLGRTPIYDVKKNGVID